MLHYKIPCVYIIFFNHLQSCYHLLIPLPLIQHREAYARAILWQWRGWKLSRVCTGAQECHWEVKFPPPTCFVNQGIWLVLTLIHWLVLPYTDFWREDRSISWSLSSIREAIPSPRVPPASCWPELRCGHTAAHCSKGSGKNIFPRCSTTAVKSVGVG